MNLTDKTPQNQPTLGQKLSPILVEIEDTLWEKEANAPEPLLFTEEGRRAGIKIFMAVLLDMLWEHQNKTGVPQEKRVTQAEEVGSGVSLLVKQYTGVDTKELYKKL